MSDLVTAITTGVTVDKLMGQLVPIAGVIVFSILFAFGWRILRKNIKGIPNGKAKV